MGESIHDTKAALLAILGDRSVAYHPLIARILGGATTGILFSQLFYWMGRGADPDGWVYKTQAEIEGETALTRWEQETARKHLKAQGVLEECYRDMPRRLYFRINVDRAIELLQAYLEQHRPSPQPATNKPGRKRGRDKTPPPEHPDEDRSAPDGAPVDPPDRPRPTPTTIRAERAKVQDAVEHSTNPQAVLAKWAGWVSGEQVHPSAMGGLVKRMSEAAPHKFARDGRPDFRAVCIRLVPLIAQAAVDAPADQPFLSCLYRFLEDWAEIPHLGPQARARDKQAAAQVLTGAIRLVSPIKAAQPQEVSVNA